MLKDVTIWHLELSSPSQLVPARPFPPRVELRRAEVPLPEFNRFLYTAVGGDWFWIDRLPWTEDQWMRWLDRPELETWVLYVWGSPAAYFELEIRADQRCEIAYFGVLPRFASKGYGGPLLEAAVRRGFERGATQLLVNTCSLDHPAALAHYKKRGFVVVRKETKSKELPDRSPGPWPGARA